MIDFSALSEFTIPEGIVVKITSGAKVLWEKSGLLPSAYKRVEYIATDGNQYIDTGIKASDYQDGLEYVFEGCCTGVHSSKSNNYLFGALANSKRSGNISWGKDNVFNVIIGATASAFYTKSVNLNTDFTLQVKATSKTLDNFVAKYNGVSFSRSGATFSGCDMPSANIYLLACNINGSHTSSTSAPFTGKLYSFIMRDMNGNELRHFIPCYRKADGVIGLYDTVGKSFYTNKGTGAFTKGADVELPSTYQRVEYIATDGNQYINTGVNLSEYTSGLQFTFDGAFTDFTSTANGYLFGGYRSDAGRIAFSFKKSSDGDTNNAFTFWVGTARAIGFANIPEVGKQFSLVATGVTTDATSATARLNGVDGIKLSGAASSNKMPDVELRLFTCNNYETVKYCGKLYKFAIDDTDGTHVRYFVPCYRKSDNVVGLYDTVGKMFYENKGTGSFTYGLNRYTNLFSTSDPDYSVGRLNSSGAVNTSFTSGFVSGFIPVTFGTDVIRAKGSTAFGSNYGCIAFYKADKTFINQGYITTGYVNVSSDGLEITIDTSDMATSVYAESVYFRIMGYGSAADFVITKNEEIV